MSRSPKRLQVAAFLILLVFAFPQYAQANAGTPLMWAGVLHLIFGNALIGIFEGLLIGWLFSRSKWKSVLLMIAANYLSAWLGASLMGGFMRTFLHPDFSNAWQCLWIMVGASYVFTLFVEWPFVALCFWRANKWLRKSVLASLTAQTASYVILFGWYSSVSGVSLYTEMNIVEPSEMSLPESVMVYYISSEDGDVYERNLTGGKPRKVYDLNSRENEHLVFRPNESDPIRWDLVSQHPYGFPDDSRARKLLTYLAVDAPDLHDSSSTSRHLRRHPFATYTFADSDGKWQFETGFYPSEGIQAKNTETDESVRFAYATPFMKFWFRNGTHLPGDILLFQIDGDKICAFDPATRQVSLLWRGRAPTPFIKRKTSDKPQ